MIPKDQIAKALTDVLVSHSGPTGYSDNICDALFAVAAAINRLAAAHENLTDAIAVGLSGLDTIGDELSNMRRNEHQNT